MIPTAFYVLNIIILVSAVAYAWATVTQLRNTSAIYNARLLPFAYYSLASWALWVCLYLTATMLEAEIRNSFYNLSFEFLAATSNWINLIQIALLVIAVLSLYLSSPLRFSLSIPSLIAFSVIAGFVCYGTEFTSSYLFQVLNTVFSAIVFWAFIPAVLRLRVSRWFALVFWLYGLAQLLLVMDRSTSLARMLTLLVFPPLRAVLLLAWTKLITMLLQRAQSSYDKVVKEIESLPGLPNPMASFGVMISSTVDDLLQERDAADQAIR